jgi:hypothetical protein
VEHFSSHCKFGTSQRFARKILLGKETSPNPPLSFSTNQTDPLLQPPVSPASRLRAPPRSLTDMATASGAPPPAMDEKARRTRDLLASFYNTDPSAAAAAGAAAPASLARPSPTATPASPLDSINSTSFDPEIYMNVLVRALVRSPLPPPLVYQIQLPACPPECMIVSVGDILHRLWTNVMICDL